MSYFDRVANHVDRGLDKRAGPFQDTTTENVLRPLLEQVQELEDIAWSLFDALFVDNATGDQLRLLGERVGEDPLGDSDEEYRLRIKLKIRASASSGTLSRDFPDMLALLGNDLVWKLYEISKFIRVELVSGSVSFSAGTLHRILSFAASAGIDVALTMAADSEANEDLMFFGATDVSIAGANWPSTDTTIAGANWPATWSD